MTSMSEDDQEKRRETCFDEAASSVGHGHDLSTSFLGMTPYEKKAALLDIEMKEHEIQRKLLRVKSDPADGNMCRNCHM